MDVDLFTTTPQSVDFNRLEFLHEINRVSGQSESFGYKGILIYSDNRLADPWMVAGIVLAATTRLLPMIALQPMYMHPYTVAKKIASIGLIYDRAIALNLVAGGFVNDLRAIADLTPHDRRYDRLAEYAEIIQLLLTSSKAVSYKGEFYEIKNMQLQPALPQHLQPEYYLSGSSDMARKTASRLGARLIQYPAPNADYTKAGSGIRNGIRVGVLARETHHQAWTDARIRFPKTRTGELFHQMAKKTSDSEWHKTLSGQEEYPGREEPVYWLGPFRQYNTFCPYLVGDYEEVARELSGYLQTGCTTCILDIPVSEIDLESTREVFEKALNYTEKV